MVGVRFLLFYSEFAPTDSSCNMLQTPKKYEEAMSNEQPLIVYFLDYASGSSFMSVSYLYISKKIFFQIFNTKKQYIKCLRLTIRT